MSETEKVQSPFGNSIDSGTGTHDSCSMERAPKEMVDAEVLVIQTTSSGLVKKERHLSSSSSSSKRPSLSKENYYCGVGRCRPKWMQVFVDARFFTFLLCLNCFIEGALVSGFTSVVLSSIERRYGFSSTAAGAIAATFDASVLVSVLFISYFGGRGHKPRWLGASLIIQGLGAFVFALPQFVFGEYTAGAALTEQFESCAAGSADLSSDCEGSNNFALAFFIIGNILIGIGAAPLFTIGTSYLDDIVSPKHVSVHIGIFYMVTVIGPALGYGLGGAFLSVFVDPWVETRLEPTDPGWVGAWWLAFIFSGVMSWLISIPFFMFPRLLPDSHLVKQERQQEMAQKYQGKFGETEEFTGKLRSFPYHLKQVITTPSWIFITIAISSSLIVVAGMVSFAPKYLESQFGLTAFTASIVAGAVAIPAGGAGVITGALIVYFSKATGRKVGFITWIITLITIPSTLVFIIHCPSVQLAGVTASYSDGLIGGGDTRFLNATCVSNCNCSSTIFEPVCGADGLTYFSPCRASCQKSVTTINGVLTNVFENCSCVSGNLASQLFNTTPHMASSLDQFTFDLLPNGTAVEGRCDQGCNLIGPFLVVIAVALFLIFMLQVPYVIITVRCVADEQRTLALGVQSLVFRAFGSIPGPIVFGVIFDSACIFWQYDCSRQGSCWVYDNSSLSERAVLLAVMGVTLNFIFSFLSWIVYPKQTQSEKEAKDIALKSIHEITPQDNSNQVELGGDSESLESSDSYTIQGPQSPPKRRTSNRYESHCSEDVLLDHDHTEIDEGVVFTDLHNMRAQSVETEVSSPKTIVQPPTN